VVKAHTPGREAIQMRRLGALRVVTAQVVRTRRIQSDEQNVGVTYSRYRSLFRSPASTKKGQH